MPDEGDETVSLPPPPEAAGVSTVEIETPLLRPRAAQIALLFLVAAAAGFVVGIGIAVGLRRPAEPAARVVAWQRVGPQGGVVHFDESEVVVPAGALAEPVTMTVRVSSFRDPIRVRASGTTRVVPPGELRAYSFEPSTLTFLRPVSIVFRLPPGAKNGTAFVRVADEVVLLGGTVDPDRQTVTVEVTDFSFER